MRREPEALILSALPALFVQGLREEKSFTYELHLSSFLYLQRMF